MYLYLWLIWFNWFNFVHLDFVSCITSQSEPIKTQLVLFNRKPMQI